MAIINLLRRRAVTDESKKLNELTTRLNSICTEAGALKSGVSAAQILLTSRANATGLVEEKEAEVSISAADIVATGTGKLGHANGYPLVAAPGAGKVLQLMDAILIYDYATAGYTDGGNLSINISGGGAALTGIISAANSLGATADKIVSFVPLSTAGVNLTANTGLNLVAAAAFTQPGTAAGVVRVKVKYREITTGLA